MADTPNGETGAGAPGTNGTTQEQQTDTVAKAEYDKLAAEAVELRKEKVQAELERNQKRNEAAEAAKQKAEQDKDFETLFKLMKQEVEETKTKYESSAQTIQTDKARDEALAKLPEKLRGPAKDLLSKATTPDQVAEKTIEVVNLAKSLGIDIEELPASPVTVLNGRPQNNQGITDKPKTQAEWKEELHTRLMKDAGK